MKRQGCVPFGETGNAAGEETIGRKENIMGDKSPKAVNKQATQKQTKNKSAVQRKQQAIAAKQVAGKKQ